MNTNDSDEPDRLRGKINDLIGDVGEELICDGVRGREFLGSILGSLGTPRDRIIVKGPRSNGPDFLVEDKGTNRAIAALEIKSTTRQGMIERELSKACVSLLGHFSIPRYKHLAVGFPVAVQFDPRRTLKTGEFRYMWSIVMNPKQQTTTNAPESGLMKLLRGPNSMR